jgi:putative transposase
MASKQLPRRRSLRLSSWDYSTPAIYFVTICTHRRECLFTPAVRAVVADAWQAIPSRPAAKHVCLDEWVVMPNHLHGLLVLTDIPAELRLDGLDIADMPFPLASFYRAEALRASHEARLIAGSLGAVVGNFKSVTTRRLNNIRRTPGSPVWQRGYYERIVRTRRELEAARRYVQDNPRCHVQRKSRIEWNPA